MLKCRNADLHKSSLALKLDITTKNKGISQVFHYNRILIIYKNELILPWIRRMVAMILGSIINYKRKLKDIQTYIYIYIYIYI